MHTNQKRISHKDEVQAFWKIRMEDQVSAGEVLVLCVVSGIAQDLAAVDPLLVLTVCQLKLQSQIVPTSDIDTQWHHK